MAGYTPKRGVFAGREFSSYRQYRNALALRRGFRSWAAQQRAPREVKNRAQLAALHPEEREARRAAFDALALMRRESVSLRVAAARAGTTQAAVLRHVGPALELERGRYHARPADRLLRVMSVLGPDGVVHEVEVRGSRAASLISAHWAAIGSYLQTGDEAALQALEGKRVAGISLETDPDAIEEWQRRGVLELEDIYDLTS
jgi:hypothetical protein